MIMVAREFQQYSAGIPARTPGYIPLERRPATCRRDQEHVVVSVYNNPLFLRTNPVMGVLTYSCEVDISPSEDGTHDLIISH
jgi:hypothetical protein